MPRGKQKQKLQEHAFASRFESKIGNVRAVRGGEGKPKIGAMSETKNDMFIRHLSGEAPREDTRLDAESGSRIARAGMHGAPTIYREKPGGRKRGKRV